MSGSEQSRGGAEPARSAALDGPAAELPPIPAKRYFTIGEVSELCGVKPHVLRYWEQEFTQLRPMKRRGNRRYYQHHEVLLVRRIRELLYQQGFTISGARNRLGDASSAGPRRRDTASALEATGTSSSLAGQMTDAHFFSANVANPDLPAELNCMNDLRHELERVLLLLEV
ncbi:MAG: MerR family transcriptional regulator [Burkholderiaceae bacterium]